MITVGIVGSRRRNTPSDYNETLAAFLRLRKSIDFPMRIVSGGCPKGGDAFAERIAKTLGYSITIHYPAIHALNPKLPPRAAHAKINYARNALIAQEAQFLIAVVAPDRKGGTEDTIKRWLAAHQPLWSEEDSVKRGMLILV